MPETAPPQDSRRLAALVGLAFLLLYGATAATTVGGLDSGELTAVAHNGGLPHPPGFPTYVLFAGFIQHVLPGAPAHLSALASAVSEAGACGLLTLLLLRLGVRPFFAVLAAASFGLLPETWHLATQQEVFPLLHLAMMGILVAAWGLLAAPGPWRTAVLGLLCGLGAGVHPTILWTTPVVLVALIRSGVWRRPRASSVGRQPGGVSIGIALGLAGLLLGSATQLYLPWARDFGGLPAWRSASIVDHILRRDYGTAELGLANDGAVPCLWRYLLHLVQDGAGLLPVLVALGLWAALRDRGPERAFKRALVAAWGLAAVGFFLIARLPETPFFDQIGARFFPTADLLGALLVGLGLEALGAVGAVKTPLLKLGVPAWVATVGLLALPAGPSMGRDIVERYANDLLSNLAPNAVLIVSGDDRVSAFYDALYARDVRPDIELVVEPLLPHPWYAEQVFGGTGFQQPAGRSGIRPLVEHCLAGGRPVYVTEVLPETLAGRFATFPEGLALRVLTADRPGPSPADVEARAERFAAAHAPLGLEDWRVPTHTETDLLAAYGRPWVFLAAAYRAAGDSAGEARCRAKFAQVLPTSP